MWDPKSSSPSSFRVRETSIMFPRHFTFSDRGYTTFQTTEDLDLTISLI